MRRIALALAVLAALGFACDPEQDAAAPRATSGPSQADGLKHIVFDTDLAFDDIMALLYLLQRDDVAIDAVTITGTGEAHCDPGVSNALRLLALGGETDVPVACGRETPLQGTNAFPDEWRTAVDDLSMLDLPEVDATADPRGATDLLLDTLDGDATLITLGPLTNVAEALRADPALAERVPEFVAMAGAIDTVGNTPNGVAEYNVWVDPLAAREVIAEMDVSLVPLDATEDVPFTSFFVDALDEHLTTPEAEAVRAIIASNEPIFTQGGYQFWDTLATALVFRPELATWDEARVLVTASLDAGAGWIDRWDEGATVRFANAVPDPLAFESEYLSVLTGEDVTAVRPEPTITIVFDGERCTVEPSPVGSGEQVLDYVGPPGETDNAFLIGLDGATYAEIRRFLGPDGSIVPPAEGPPEGVREVAFVQGLTKAEVPDLTLVAVCFEPTAQGSARAWLSRPLQVEP
ncbi:MAG TPA: nucleoside hydrolase [Actinomycetota bacterium]|nr:nucleoside hydrolase [Actinomycetota bacterium]